MSTRRSLILCALTPLIPVVSIAAAPTVHVQFERDGLPYVVPPQRNPGIYDPDWGMTGVVERRIVIRDLDLDFKKMGHVQIDVFNNTHDVAQTDAWVEISDINIAGGFAKAERAPGLKSFYVEGNGPIVLDVVLRASTKTRASDLALKIRSPYGKRD